MRNENLRWKIQRKSIVRAIEGEKKSSSLLSIELGAAVADAVVGVVAVMFAPADDVPVTGIVDVCCCRKDRWA